LNVRYVWKFDNGYFQIKPTNEGWELTIHMDNGDWDRFGYYATPHVAADVIARLDPEVEPPFEINLSTTLPPSLENWEMLRSL